MIQELHLRCSPRAIRSPQAWLLLSPNPADWVAEVTGWDVDQRSLRFLPLPSTSADLTPASVLITIASQTGATAGLPSSAGNPLPTAGHASSGTPVNIQVSSKCLPYGCLADRLFLPVEAELQPAVSAAELAKMLTADYCYVWHPTQGLIAFEPPEVLRLADLIGPLAFAETDWSLGQPGVRLAGKIISLEAASPPTIEGLFGSESEDIGTESKSLDGLPKSPREPSNDPLSKAARQGGKYLANMANAVGGMAGKIAGATPGGSAWYERMQQWANRHLSGIDSALQMQRNKEVNRLLDMLKSNPDEGLKYALPMGGGASRGLAPPGGRLGRRDVNFSLGGLGGGGAADYWHMDYQYQQKLIQQYHDLANREVSLGRYRRAAYIYAHLLGDLNAAASTLMSGGHHREAAVLYRDKLSRPLDAAECLEKGGLWSEALELYDEQQQFEKVGDIYRHLEQEDEAASAYQKAISQCRSRDDYLTAARIYTEKLQDIDGALNNLADAWPYSGQASHCIRKIFEINAHEGRHEDSRRWIERFRTESAPPHMHPTRVKLSAEAAVNYPDAGLQHFAADTTRVLVASALPKSNRGEARELLKSLRDLTPHDRLLATDTRRYVDEWEIPKPKPPLKPAPQGEKISLVRVIHLGDGYTWLAAGWSDSTIYAIGYDHDRHRMIFARANWIGVVERHAAPWKLTRIDQSYFTADVLLAVQPYHDHFVFVHHNDFHLGGRDTPWHQWEIPRTDTFPNILRVGGFGSMSNTILAASRTSRNRTWIYQFCDDGPQLVAVNSEGRRLTTIPIDPALLDHETGQVALHATGEEVYLGLGRHLHAAKGGKLELVGEFNGPIESIAASAPNTLPRIAVGLESGGEALWPAREELHRIRFGHEMESPLVGINRGGFLIADFDSGCEVFRTAQRRLSFAGSFTYEKNDPSLGILSAPQANLFGVAKRDGTISVYEVNG